MSETIFVEIGLVIIVATLGAIAARFLKQPLIPAYLLAGVVVGPLLGLISDAHLILTLSEIGVVFLLFIVGLEFDFKKMRDVGVVTLVGGTLQIFLLFLVGFGVSTFFGLSYYEAMYLGFLVAFSSTMVLIKLLSDKKELDTLHGRLVLGLLVLEDILAIIALTVLSTTTGQTSVGNAVAFFVKGAILAVIVLVAWSFFLPRLFKKIANSMEVLFLSAISVCFVFSLLFSYVGLSASIGAFLGGILLGNLPYNVEIIGRVKPLRDFFATLFFASLGMQLTFTLSTNLYFLLAVFVVLIIIIKPLLFMVITSVFGYRKHPVFMAAIALSQVSEFGLIIMAQGAEIGVIGPELFSLSILLGIITIAVTTYYFNYDSWLYEFFKGPLSIFDRFSKGRHQMDFIPEGEHQDIVLCGYNRVGFGIFKKLQETRQTFIVVDFNPEVIRDLISQKIPCLYGDVGDLEVLERLEFKKRKMVISTIFDVPTNKLLIQKAREENSKIIIFVTAHHVEEAISLYDAGADYVILPHFLGGDHVSFILEDMGTDVSKLIKRKLTHIEELHHHHHKGHHGHRHHA